MGASKRTTTNKRSRIRPPPGEACERGGNERDSELPGIDLRPHQMKTLFLVRHAKSARDDPSLPDKERPLNDRGMRDAPKMGQRLAKRHVKPDLILSSPAR